MRFVARQTPRFRAGTPTFEGLPSEASSRLCKASRPPQKSHPIHGYVVAGYALDAADGPLLTADVVARFGSGGEKRQCRRYRDRVLQTGRCTLKPTFASCATHYRWAQLRRMGRWSPLSPGFRSRATTRCIRSGSTRMAGYMFQPPRLMAEGVNVDPLGSCMIGARVFPDMFRGLVAIAPDAWMVTPLEV